MFVLILACLSFPQTQEDDEIKVSLGSSGCESKSGIILKFVEVVGDSRCPEGANCIWAGNAQIRITIARGESVSDPLELETNGPKGFIDFDGYRIKLKALEPYPKSGERTDSATYKATFEIKKNDDVE